MYSKVPSKYDDYGESDPAESESAESETAE